MTSSSEALDTLRWGGRRTAPYAFTEQGVAMLSSVLSSSQAVQVNIAIILKTAVQSADYLEDPRAGSSTSLFEAHTTRTSARSH